MQAHLRANVLLLGLTLLICSVCYPLAVLAFGQAFFPFEANGSLIGADSRAANGADAVGSRLIAQEFKGDEYFQPRPSAASYDGAASAGSNWAASNPQLRDRVSQLLQADSHHGPDRAAADAVTASGSGLDPHITLRNARHQLGRVVAAQASKTGVAASRVRPAVESILNAHAFTPLAGLLGAPLVNVLEVNLVLRSAMEKLAER